VALGVGSAVDTASIGTIGCPVELVQCMVQSESILKRT
jgi:hypothetical protein